MQGVMIFKSLPEAIRQGFYIYDKIKEGYLIRRKNADGLWEQALVHLGN